jgi:hypothetical protein
MDEKLLLERIEKLETEIAKKNESKVKAYFGKAISKTNAIVGIIISFIVTGVVLYAAQINFKGLCQGAFCRGQRCFCEVRFL